MKPIEIQFTQKRWQHSRLFREGNIAIYERSKEGTLPHYEVVRIKSHNGFQIPGTEERSEPAEYYPSDNAWGAHGFTFNSIEDAAARAEQLIKEQSSPAANCCPRCGSDTFGWDGTIERFDCYKCGLTETEEQNSARANKL
jgi:ribosomal protein S27AE